MQTASLKPALTLDAISASFDRLPLVRKKDLLPGDWVIVKTKNSEYVIGRSLDGRLMISGGWFDSEGSSPATVDVSGCTFGGHAIHGDLLAAPGLFLEFANQVTTTRIQEVRHFKATGDSLVS